MTYRVEQHYLPGMPRTRRDARPFRLIACHDTEGASGYSGAIGTMQWMVSTAAARNASYGELWAWEPALDRFVVIRSVPPEYAAHSIAPQRDVYRPDQWVRDSLGDGWADPNYWVYAVSIAGRVREVDAWSADPRFVGYCRRRLRELRAELGVSRIAEHFRFQPTTRSDWGKRLTPALGGLEISDEEDDMLPADMTGKAEEWTTVSAGTPFWTRGCGIGEQRAIVNQQAVDSIIEVGADWRIVRLVPSRQYVFVQRKSLVPKVRGGDPLYDEAVFRVIAEGPQLTDAKLAQRITNAAASIVTAERALGTVTDAVAETRDALTG